MRSFLAPFLPAPLVVKKGDRFELDHDRPKSIGRVRSFFGNVGILLRGYCYIRTLGPAGLREVTENAVLNANYVLARVKGAYEVPHGERCMHEFVASARQLKREKRTSEARLVARCTDRAVCGNRAVLAESTDRSFVNGCLGDLPGPINPTP